MWEKIYEGKMVFCLRPVSTLTKTSERGLSDRQRPYAVWLLPHIGKRMPIGFNSHRISHRRIECIEQPHPKA